MKVDLKTANSHVIVRQGHRAILPKHDESAVIDCWTVFSGHTGSQAT